MAKLTDKGRGIRDMFQNIAPQYDLLNRVLSFGIDRYWRKFAVRQLQIPENGRVLDIATGTGDVALTIAAKTPDSVNIVGEDFTQGMLLLGREKIAASSFADRIQLVNAPCESIPHPSNLFDGITIAFGIRNVVDRAAGLREMCRVLKAGGRAVILEFSTPKANCSGVFIIFISGGFFRRSAGSSPSEALISTFPTPFLIFPHGMNFRR